MGPPAPPGCGKPKIWPATVKRSKDQTAVRDAPSHAPPSGPPAAPAGSKDKNDGNGGGTYASFGNIRKG